MHAVNPSPPANGTHGYLAIAFVLLGQIGVSFFAAMPMLPRPMGAPGVSFPAAIMANLLAAGLLFAVSILLGKVTRVSRAVLVPLLSLATFWHWLLITAFVFSGGVPHGSDWLALLPLPIAFVLSFLGLTIGRAIVARTRANQPAATPAP